MQVRGWDPDGTIVLNDVSCTSYSAVGHGGCFHGSGKVVFNDGTVMLNNQGDHGGSICKCNSFQSVSLETTRCYRRHNVSGRAFFVLKPPSHNDGREGGKQAC